MAAGFARHRDREHAAADGQKSGKSLISRRISQPARVFELAN